MINTLNPNSDERIGEDSKSDSMAMDSLRPIESIRSIQTIDKNNDDGST